MGVKQLNTFLTKNANDCLIKTHLSKLKNKSIAVDTSIYLYRFISENGLIEKFFEMCSLFIKYNITPIFVFDGKPPKEKEEELKKRSEIKQNAENEYNKLKKKLDQIQDENERKLIEEKMNILQKNFIRIKGSQIRDVKELLRLYGMSYIDCNGEADQICAYLCKIGKTYACLTEDMDQFIYGTERIMRYFSIIKENFVMYDINKIYKKINITKHNFKQMCILSGTDYNNSFDNINVNIFSIYNLIQKHNNNFDNVLQNITKDINKIKYNIKSILNIYVSYDEKCRKYKNINIQNSMIDKEGLFKLLNVHNFIVI